MHDLGIFSRDRRTLASARTLASDGERRRAAFINARAADLYHKRFNFAYFLSNTRSRYGQHDDVTITAAIEIAAAVAISMARLV